MEYQAKCREFRRVLKYRCAHLILKPDSTYYYEEIAVDLPMAIESGHYQIEYIPIFNRRGTITIRWNIQILLQYFASTLR